MPKILIPREVQPGEARVAATPETVRVLKKLGYTVTVEAGAGTAAALLDESYLEAGAEVAQDVSAAWSQADLVLKVSPPTESSTVGGHEARALREGAAVIAFLAPHKNLPMVRALSEKKVSALAMELVPRITRAQKMDALSSQANIAGYKAVLIAAVNLPKYFPLLMTAAGTIKPARVVVMGAGVAGLQAIATARRLGAVVHVSDIRPAVKEQVQSLGAQFIELPMAESGEGEGGYAKEMSADFLQKQQEIIAEHVEHADVVITTAQIPGKPAPELVSADMVARMKPGSVIVDLAAEQGGNCALTQPGQEVIEHGVRIVGAINVPSSMPLDASTVYARNVLALVEHLSQKRGEAGDEGVSLEIDPDDEITGATLLTHKGAVTHPPTAQALRDESAASAAGPAADQAPSAGAG